MLSSHLCLNNSLPRVSQHVLIMEELSLEELSRAIVDLCEHDEPVVAFLLSVGLPVVERARPVPEKWDAMCAYDMVLRRVGCKYAQAVPFCATTDMAALIPKDLLPMGVDEIDPRPMAILFRCPPGVVLRAYLVTGERAVMEQWTMLRSEKLVRGPILEIYKTPTAKEKRIMGGIVSLVEEDALFLRGPSSIRIKRYWKDIARQLAYLYVLRPTPEHKAAWLLAGNAERILPLPPC